MKKCFYILIFLIVISFLLVLTAYLGFRSYLQINSSDAISYLVDKYEIEKKDIKALKFLKYSYASDCTQSSSKNCSEDKSLLYSFWIITRDNQKILVNQYKNKVFHDNFINGTVRDTYLKKMEIINNNNNNLFKIEDKVESN